MSDKVAAYSSIAYLVCDGSKGSFWKVELEVKVYPEGKKYQTIGVITGSVEVSLIVTVKPGPPAAPAVPLGLAGL